MTTIKRRRERRIFARWLRRAAAAAALLGAAAIIALAVAWHAMPFPMHRLDGWPSSPRITDRDGQAMLCRTGCDGQWRLPVPGSAMSPWLIEATIAVEDHRFREHKGVDPLAVARAALQNLTAGRVVSGASTITMQVCRMMDDRPRTLSSKLIESFRALQLERLRGKDQIIELYLNLAPYGGNVRGVEAAAQRYFGRSAGDLTLAEAALLAGLPQSPSRHRPDRHPQAARRRQATVLRRMPEIGRISGPAYRDALAAPLHLKREPPRRLPGHVAWMALASRPAGGTCTIDGALQDRVEQMVQAHAAQLPDRCDIAVVVVAIASSEVLALVGSADLDDPLDGQVNGAAARRSPGSALKPFIYAAAFQSRRLAPASILHDVPIHRGGWSPRNAGGKFAGRVTAAQALRRSLNVPAILITERLGPARCAEVLVSAGIDPGPGAADRAGLALAVGGVEVSLLDLAEAYATIGRGGAHRPLRLFADAPGIERPALDPAACAAIDEILSSRARRPGGLEHLSDERLPWFMWKTGTSSGHRDAWAVGHNGAFAAGVWVGRFDGAAEPALSGAASAEPLLARIFDLPALRVEVEPPPAPAWTVTRPWPPPAERSGRLAIVEPSDGAILMSPGGAAIVHCRANRQEDLAWFLNGRLVAHDGPVRLRLVPGGHELRCVAGDGESATARLQVR